MRPCGAFAGRGAYTLVEILVATALSLLLLGAVVRMFGQVGQSITDSRSMLESADRLRLTATRLQQDLAGVTVTMSPPRKPENNEGYFEYIEGPMTSTNASTYAINTDYNNNGDTTVGDVDDILMFTTRSTGQPFVGRFINGTAGVAQSDVAEVAWFVRGRTLYRRQLLVLPSANLTSPSTASYADTDISMRLQGGSPVANTLGDLTKRECRFAHPTATFPFDAAACWTWQLTLPAGGTASLPTLPTLRECACSGWTIGASPTAAGTPKLLSAPFAPLAQLDLWSNSTSYRLPDTAFAPSTASTRVDDVILTNVIGFDVKAWDPGAQRGRGGVR